VRFLSKLLSAMKLDATQSDTDATLPINQQTAKVIAYVALAVVLLVLVQGILSAQGWTIIPADFELSGQFGDSFGPLSAIMASLAALGAWSAVALQRSEMRAAEKQRDDEAEASADRDFDNHFYNLLSNLDSIIAGIDYGVPRRLRTPETKHGRDAIRLFRNDLQTRLTSCSFDSWGDEYRDWFSGVLDDFGHYFRFLYHLICYIDLVSPNAVISMGFLRAKLSDSELVLLGFNCAFGEGRGQFKRLVEKYHLLHNISEGSLADSRLRELFPDRAFAPGMNSKFLGLRMENKYIKVFGKSALYDANDDDPASSYRSSTADHADTISDLLAGDITMEEAAIRMATSHESG
jgi:Putative phage abortive infection protein